jgi:hypothetical protein
MRMRRALTIGVLALLGLAVAVAITMAASSLSSQSIGLSDEPLDAGDALVVPPAATTRPPRAQPTRDAAPQVTTRPQVTTPPKVTTPPQVTTEQTRTTGGGADRGARSPEDSGSGRSGSDDGGGRSGSDDSGGDD